MSIQFSGIGSGMDYVSWIEQLVEAKKATTITPLENKKTELQSQSSALNTIKTSFSELQSALKKFTSVISGTSNDIWNKMAVTSSNEDYVTATGSNGLTVGDIKVSVEQLATKTTAQSTKVPTNAEGEAINLDGKLSDIVSEGTIKINGASFTIDDKTTLQSLINEINSSSEANVNVRFNTVSNKLTFTSKETGATNIEFESEDSDFFEMFGLTENGAIASGSQTLGQNAILNIDGNTIESTSNVVTGDVSGIRGLTITAKKVTDGSGEDKVNEVTLSVANDTTEIKTAIKDFVNAYNKVSEQIAEVTAKDGYLAMDTSLRSIQSELRNMLSSTASDLGVTGTPEIPGFDNIANTNTSAVRGSLLSVFGLSTGDAGLSVDDTATTLKFDEEEFDKVWEASPDFIKTTLTGGKFEGNTAGESVGVFAKMEERINNMLDPVNGMFATRTNSLSRMMTTQDERITRAYNSLDSYESQLTTKFQYMDQMIAKLQQQYASFLS